MKNKYLSIDFEFFNTQEKDMTVVCAALTESVEGKQKTYWLLDTKEKQRFLGDIKIYRSEGYIFLAHSVSAEARSFMSLGEHPNLVLGDRAYGFPYRWVDTMREWRCVTNHYSKLRYGKHYIKGEVKNLRPVGIKSLKGGTSHDKLTHSMAEMVYKLLGKKIDSERKTKMRDIILSKDLELIESYKDEIMEYCLDDTRYLLPCLQEMAKVYAKKLKPKDKKDIIQEMLWRGQVEASVAAVERRGYPIDVEKARNLSRNAPFILRDIQKDINEQFPDILPYHFDKKTGFYVQKKKPIDEWIKKSSLKNEWERTDKGQFSHSHDAFAKHFHFRHDFPRDNFGAQMLRYFKVKQSLNGFIEAKTDTGKRKKFWDSVGSDGFVRSNLNSYGAQSGRFQPSATDFLFLKAAWTRSLCVPPKGFWVVGIDYKSEEFLISALLSGDKKMLAAYNSGDVYLAFGKEVGMIPKKGSKKTHPIERQACKSTVLGISYDMTKVGLAKKLTQDTGKPHTEEQAQHYIDLFAEAYPVFYNWKQEFFAEYNSKGYFKFDDGWIMWGDNPNPRSVGNVPIQGKGAEILRKAMVWSELSGLNPILPLHDAMYFISEFADERHIINCAKIMEESFTQSFPKKIRDKAKPMLDIEVWGSDIGEEEETEIESYKVKFERLHIDERAEKEYRKFEKYFDRPKWLDL